jgi:hypothetical protein
MARKKSRKTGAIKLMIALDNDTSGILADEATQAANEDGITQAVIDLIEDQNWSLRDGDSIRITVIED